MSQKQPEAKAWSKPELTPLGKLADVAGKETAGLQGTQGKS